MGAAWRPPVALYGRSVMQMVVFISANLTGLQRQPLDRQLKLVHQSRWTKGSIHPTPRPPALHSSLPYTFPTPTPPHTAPAAHHHR